MKPPEQRVTPFFAIRALVVSDSLARDEWPIWRSFHRDRCTHTPERRRGDAPGHEPSPHARRAGGRSARARGSAGRARGQHADGPLTREHHSNARPAREAGPALACGTRGCVSESPSVRKEVFREDARLSARVHRAGALRSTCSAGRARGRHANGRLGEANDRAKRLPLVGVSAFRRARAPHASHASEWFQRRSP